jgi:hypothetical protein
VSDSFATPNKVKSWIFMELGKPVLGPNSVRVLGEALNAPFSEIMSMVGTDRVLVPTKLPAAEWHSQNQAFLDQLISFIDSATSNSNHTLNLKNGLQVEPELDSVYLDDIPWSVSAEYAFIDLHLTEETKMSDLGVLTWGDFLRVSNWRVLLEVIHNCNDYLPDAYSKKLLVPDSEDLREFVEFFENFSAYRTGIEPKTYASYRGILTRRYGLGVAKESLDEIGSSAGVTRERIRQKEQRIERQWLGTNFYPSSALSRIIERKYEPSFEPVEKTLAWALESDLPWDVEGLRNLILLYCGPATASRFHSKVTSSEEETLEIKAAKQVIQKSRSKLGIILKAGLLAKLPNLSEAQVLSLVRKLYPKSQVSGNYIDASTAHLDSFMYNMIIGQLAINSPLPVHVLQEGIDRGSTIRQSKNHVPTVKALKEFLTFNDRFDVDEDGLVSYTGIFPYDDTLVGWMVAELRKYPGQIAGRAEIVRSALAKGFKISTIAQYVTFGVEFRLGGQGTIHLVGSNYSQKQLDECLLRIEKTEVKAQILNFEKESDSVFTATFNLSSGFMVSGVLTVTSELGQSFGSSAREIRCCPSYEAKAHPKLSGKTLLANMAAARDHLITVHGLVEGDIFHLVVNPVAIQMVVQ